VAKSIRFALRDQRRELVALFLRWTSAAQERTTTFHLSVLSIQQQFHSTWEGHSVSVVVITGSSGLVGSESAIRFHEKGLEIVGIDNNLRELFFGAEGSTAWRTRILKQTLKHFTHYPVDIRNEESIRSIFRKYGKNISLIIHAASQPSHDWATQDPLTDFNVNANGTLTLLEATRQYSPNAIFIFTSTNKVYGDTPNRLPMSEQETRWEVDEFHPYFAHGIDENMTIDHSQHSLMGVSKAAADLLAQEYARCFGLRTCAFRAGCLTGAAHSGTEQHGFLSYLVKCVMTGRPYTIFGYKGKQVRDHLHSSDLIEAFWLYYQNPTNESVYNMGGSRHSHCSVLEAIQLIEELSGKNLECKIVDRARAGDHIWWVSDVRKFQRAYPAWRYQYDLKSIVEDLIQATAERCGARSL
jgi:CDP-paratose 2-epimerase